MKVDITYKKWIKTERDTVKDGGGSGWLHYIALIMAHSLGLRRTTQTAFLPALFGLNNASKTQKNDNDKLPNL